MPVATAYLAARAGCEISEGLGPGGQLTDNGNKRPALASWRRWRNGDGRSSPSFGVLSF